MKPITDKAEVAIDFPDKTYMGSFGRGSGFELTADEEGVHLHLARRDGEKRRVAIHVHYYLLADILRALAEETPKHPADGAHRRALADAARKLAQALR